MIEELSHVLVSEQHPMDNLLRQDRLPHIWCPGCGLGTVLTCFVSALQKSGLDPQKVIAVSGIGCTGRTAGYLNLDGFHTTHGRAIPFATGLKLGNPELKVVVISGGLPPSSEDLPDLQEAAGDELVQRPALGE